LIICAIPSVLIKRVGFEAGTGLIERLLAPSHIVALSKKKKPGASDTKGPASMSRE
jgi:hypothetical protein